MAAAPAETMARYTTLGTLNAHRLQVGLWQVSSQAWGRYPSPDVMVQELRKYFDAGFNSFDMADHYGDAELLFAKFQKSIPGPSRPVGCTKWCPRPGKMSRATVEAAIRERCTRMGVQSLDLMAFHWWDYEMKQELADAMKHLHDLHKEGVISNLSLTNFDSAHVEQFCKAGIPIVSNQVQFSLIDLRPTVKMAAVCEKYNVKLLTYGTLCGGFLANKYLGQPDPSRTSITPSQRKYLQMVQIWGGWGLFQELLGALDKVAKRKGNGVDIANVATRYILDKPYVGGVIVGARVGISEHIAENLRVFDFQLDAADHADIDAVLKKGKSAEQMFAIIGDCGDEYRG
ncbi:aldo/keto reductase [Hyaloraphidium curvatum]|nr:aldo/keto reductase [Hyaloraphidium curvatum]